jgi:cytochrome c oxidase subunit II
LGSLISRTAPAQAGREIEMVAQRFQYTPAEINLKAGEKVVLAIRSLDFVHGFNIPDLGVRADLVPGKVTKVEITPTKVGKLDFVCDNFCGDKHEEMHGTFIVSA